MTIGLFYGSDTGNTSGIATEIKKYLDAHFTVEEYDIQKFNEEDFGKYHFLVVGLSTWYDGELQSDWDTYLERFSKIDFTGKTVAMYGLGDQAGYPEYFCDGVGIIGQQIIDAGGKLIGKWPTKGYDYAESKAEMDSGYFCGLTLDEDFQPELTDERMERWCRQIIEEFKAIEKSKAALV